MDSFVIAAIPGLAALVIVLVNAYLDRKEKASKVESTEVSTADTLVEMAGKAAALLQPRINYLENKIAKLELQAKIDGDRISELEAALAKERHEREKERNEHKTQIDLLVHLNGSLERENERLRAGKG